MDFISAIKQKTSSVRTILKNENHFSILRDGTVRNKNKGVCTICTWESLNRHSCFCFLNKSVRNHTSPGLTLNQGLSLNLNQQNQCQKPGVVVHAYNPDTYELRQEDQEFRASLTDCTASFRLAWTVCKETKNNPTKSKQATTHQSKYIKRRNLNLTSQADL